MEREVVYEYYIRKKWRLFDTKLNFWSGAGRVIEKVWTNEKILSKRAPEWLLSGDAFKWKTKGTFAYDAGTGRDTVWSACKVDGRTRGCDWTSEREKSDALGAEDE